MGNGITQVHRARYNAVAEIKMTKAVCPAKKLTIKGFRCIYDAALDLEWFTVLIGKNDTGKSSILEAIALLAASHRGQFGAFVRDGGAIDSTEWISHSKGNAEIKLLFEDNVGLGMGMGTDGTRPSEPWLLYKLTREGVQWNQLQNHQRESVPGLEGLRSRLVGTQRAYQLSPKAMRRPVPTGTLDNNPLPSDGTGLVDALDRLSHKAFGELLAEYSTRIPTVEEVLLEAYRTAGGVQQGTKEIRFRLTNGDEISCRQASDGAMLVLGLLSIVYEKEPPQLVLLEEPENGIHPGQLEKLIQAITDLSIVKKRVQIVMTTHSPYVLDAVDAANVRVVSRDPIGGTKVERFADLPEIRNKLGAGFTVGEAWVNMPDNTPAGAKP